MSACHDPTVVLEGLKAPDLEAVHADVVARDVLEMHANLKAILGENGLHDAEKKSVKELIADTEANLAPIMQMLTPNVAHRVKPPPGIAWRKGLWLTPVASQMLRTAPRNFQGTQCA